METVTERKKTAGRPAKTVKRDVRACIRFTRPEYFIVKEKAAQAGFKPSAYIRRVAIYTTISNRLTEEERHWVRHLVGMSNNFNQVAKCCHKEGALKAMVAFEAYRNFVDEILRKLKPKP